MDRGWCDGGDRASVKVLRDLLQSVEPWLSKEKGVG